MMLCYCIQDYFKTYLIQQRNYGSNTLMSYRDTFKLLISYLIEQGMRPESMEMAELNDRAVIGFLNWLETARGNALSTRNVRLAHLKSFSRYVLSTSPDDVGTCASLCSLPPKSRTVSPPDSLSRDEVACLLAMPGTDTKAGLRDTAMLTLLYDSACRAQEIADLNAGDIVTNSPCSVSVMGKGRKRRRVPLMKETGKLLDVYISSQGVKSSGPLFVNRSGKRLTRAGVSNVVERHWEKAMATNPEIAIHKNVKPHLLRHSKATHLVEEQVNIFYIRDFLGHSSVTTTQIYLKSNIERMRKAVEAAEVVAAPLPDFYAGDKKTELMDFLNNLV